MKKLILSLMFACAACSGGTQTRSHAELLGAKRAAGTQQGAQPDAKADAGTLTRIRTMVGNAACTGDAQCHTLALGAKACGGPESYIAWSSAQVEEDALRALGDAYKEERRAANSASGMMSNCRFMVDPGAMCKAGTCQLGGGDALAR